MFNKIIGILIFIIATALNNNTVTKPDLKLIRIYNQLKVRIAAQRKYIRRWWSPKQIMAFAHELKRISTKHNVDSDHLVALCETESNFFKKASHENENGSVDRGLWSQNSCCYKDRYRKVFKAKLKDIRWLYNVKVSTRLMEQTLLECRRHKGPWLIICYNYPMAADAKRYTKYYTGRFSRKLKLARLAINGY